MLWLPAQTVHTFPMMSYLWLDTLQLCCFVIDKAKSVNIVHSYWSRAGCWAVFPSGTAWPPPLQQQKQERKADTAPPRAIEVAFLGGVVAPVDMRRATDLIYLDFWKTFDMVLHNILGLGLVLVT